MNPDLTFYYQPNKARRSEAAFVAALQKYHANPQTLNQHYFVDQNRVDKFVSTQQLTDWLTTDTGLSDKKRLACLDLLKTIPSESIRIALHPKEISFDVVAEAGEKVYYWEFHEKQHQNLSVDRQQHVYTPEGSRVTVPRYFQRLVRDVWRALYFDRYTVVWQNWFETPKRNTTEALDLADGYREFFIEGKFSFKHFVGKNAA